MNALLTDLYQLTMAAGYFEAGKSAERATFELFVRKLPDRRNFLVAAGLAQAVDYLLNLRFTGPEIDFLRRQPQFERASRGFFEALREFRFSGDLFAVREGTPVFAGEPILELRAPIIEAQIPETYLLATIGFETLVASKAARIVAAAAGHAVIEFGTRRAHSPDAGVLAGRAAYIGGCVGTSNTLSGFRYDVPVFGTAAHSWVQAFAGELQSFRKLQDLLGPSTVYLIDTYDTLEGARQAASLGKPLWGVRLDSGNLVELSRGVRAILDQAGLQDAKIMATGDLDEYRIMELIAAGAPVDAFGVGTSLSTSSDAPALGAVYKLIEVDVGGVTRYTAKFSPDKQTLAATKQIFRYGDRDVIGCSWECPSCPPGSEPSEALLQPVLVGGRLVEPLPEIRAAREHAARSIARLPARLRSLAPAAEPYPVSYSGELLALQERVRKSSNRAEG